MQKYCIANTFLIPRTLYLSILAKSSSDTHTLSAYGELHLKKT